MRPRTQSARPQRRLDPPRFTFRTSRPLSAEDLGPETQRPHVPASPPPLTPISPLPPPSLPRSAKSDAKESALEQAKADLAAAKRAQSGLDSELQAVKRDAAAREAELVSHMALAKKSAISREARAAALRR